MVQKLPQAFLNSLLARTNIVPLIQSRIQLKKKGHEYLASCPFHQDKTPSFTVSEKKQFYYCFGCGAHGNAIGFLMGYDQLDFLTAVETLATQAGMAMPAQFEHHEDHRAYHDLMAQCMTLYAKQLNHPTAQAFCKARQIPPDVATRFKLGMAPDAWYFLKQALPKHGQHTQALITLGMLMPAKGEKAPYDRFRGRMMFPIRSDRGQVLAFGGRCFGDQQPKYLNSPETPIFHKRQTLYGIYEAKQQCQQLSQLLVVEGYMDVVALASHGIHHAVATLGTAITSGHLQQLFKHCHALVFCFDGDLAGRKAAWKACELSLPFMHDGRQVAFLFLPEKEDPDSFVQRHGPEALLRLIDQAQSLSDFFFAHCAQETLPKGHWQNPLGAPLDLRAAFGKSAYQRLGQLPEGLFKTLMLTQLGERLQLDAAQLKPLAKTAEKIQANPRPASPTPQAATTPSKDKLLRRAIALLLQYPKAGRALVLPTLNDQHGDLAQSPAWQQLVAILAIINNSSNADCLNTGSLLAHFQQHPHESYLAKLATIKLMLPESGAREELEGLLARREQQAVQASINKLLEASRAQTLTPEAKAQLQALLKAKGENA